MYSSSTLQTLHLLAQRNHATCRSFLYIHATVHKKSSFISCTLCTLCTESAEVAQLCTGLHTVAQLRTHELSTNIAIVLFFARFARPCTPLHALHKPAKSCTSLQNLQNLKSDEESFTPTNQSNLKTLQT